MKRIGLAVAVFAVAAFIAAAALAFDIPKVGTSDVKSPKALGKAASKVAFKEGINNKLAKYNCRFKPNTTEIDPKSCDINKVVTELTVAHQGAEKSFANDVDIYVEAGDAKKGTVAYDRANAICKKFKSDVSYWDCQTRTSASKNDNLKIWIDVD